MAPMAISWLPSTVAPSRQCEQAPEVEHRHRGGGSGASPGEVEKDGSQHDAASERPITTESDHVADASDQPATICDGADENQHCGRKQDPRPDGVRDDRLK